MGLKILTDSRVKRPLICTDSPRFPHPMHSNPKDLTSRYSPRGIQDKTDDISEHIRTYFPETWLWNLVPISPSGLGVLRATVPDSITEWKGQSFCLSDSGFGLSGIESFIAFKPLFVRPSLPPSVVRGERFSLPVTVFNYLPACLQVTVEVDVSNLFKVVPCTSCLYQACVCPDRDSTFQWDLTAIALGRRNITITAQARISGDSRCKEGSSSEAEIKDVIVSSIFIQAEGTPVDQVQNYYNCVTDDEPDSGNFSLAFPGDYIPGSETAYLSLTGDVIGRALDNLDHLLTLPTGCGEQNMVRLGPNVHILNYLNATGQDTPEIRERARNYLQEGYQNQLRYRHRDGSYSAFGARDEIGSLWLTAFVLWIFGQARPHIYIDPKETQQSASWLERYQDPRGCFENVGRVINTNMVGGVDGEVPLTAYVTASLLHLGLEKSAGAIRRGLNCLRGGYQAVTDPYTIALLAYTFTLAQEHEIRRELGDRLHQLAIRQDGLIHWERPGGDRRRLSLTVEMTSYALLYLLSGSEVSEDERGTATGVVKWLVTQCNPYGGFQSTQDTVVALQALARFAEVNYSLGGGEGSRSLTVWTEGFSESLEVTVESRVLRQEVRLPRAPATYYWTLRGRGCVYLQVTLRFNIPSRIEGNSFSLRVDAACRAGKRFDIEIGISYLGPMNGSGMAVVDIEMVSGFLPTESSREQLDLTVKKQQFTDGHLILYLESIRSKAEKLTVTVEQQMVVRNLEQALLKVYEYYCPENEASTEYHSPCAED
ncbi:alpha-2-macroglobulin-like protein 1 [Heterodontus francisci]|uniref:alpha-2-macroglobulin-like protein 1 n=1 Tax=Heterodontus francisci TaxID=7792 RepID=UPI00355B38E7